MSRSEEMVKQATAMQARARLLAGLEEEQERYREVEASRDGAARAAVAGGVPVREIADVLGISSSGVRSRYFAPEAPAREEPTDASREEAAA